jgi:hypothetical membrane protein
MDQKQMNAASGPSRPLAITLLLSSGIVGSLLFSLFFFIEAAITPGFNSIQQTISDLELVQNGWMQSANFIMLGIFMSLFAMGLCLELKKGIAAILLPAFQWLVALGLVLSGLFIHNPLHTIASMIAFIPLVISFFLFAWKFNGDDRWKGWTTYSIISAILMMAFLALFGMSQAHGGPAGLFERLVVAVRSLWSLFFTIRILMGVHINLPENHIPALL